MAQVSQNQTRVSRQGRNPATLLIPLKHLRDKTLLWYIHILRVQVLQERFTALVMSHFLELVLAEVEEVLAKGAERLASHVARDANSGSRSNALVDPVDGESESVFLLGSVRPTETSFVLSPKQGHVGAVLS